MYHSPNISVAGSWTDSADYPGANVDQGYHSDVKFSGDALVKRISKKKKPTDADYQLEEQEELQEEEYKPPPPEESEVGMRSFRTVIL